MKIRNLVAGLCLIHLSMTTTTLAADISNPGPAVFVRGLVMVGVDGPDALEIAIPEASGHSATLTVLTRSGQVRVLPLPKGIGSLSTIMPATKPADVRVPELVRAKELYGADVKPQIGRARTSLSIPWSSVVKVTTEKVTDRRYTFVRTDNGDEIDSFRPRQIAESIRIDLASTAVLSLSKDKVSFADAKEIWIEYKPKDPTVGGFEDHFHHYLHYLDRPPEKQFEVRPRALSDAPSPTPEMRFGNSFFPPYYLCYTLGI